ncbi:hypothetical protein RI367_006311 [Sorochytrium milnesiophthora]
MSARKASSKKGASARKKSAGTKAAPTAIPVEEWTREQLLEEYKKLLSEVNGEREERNYFQMERDKVSSFWDITRNELSETRAELLNKDRDLEEQEEKHQVEIKVYKQKVKHLLYEYQNNIAHLQTDHEQALTLSVSENDQQQQSLRKDKRSLKLELKELELSHEDIIRNMRHLHDTELSKMRAEFERRSRELYAKYEKKMKTIRDDLELRRKNEIHEIEERKNGQINALMKNHEKAFAEIKNYYNDITLNNLALINSLKEQVEEMKKKEERNEKYMADITAENKRLSEPLQLARAEGEQLRRQLTNYEKDKMSLRNAKARLKVCEEQCTQLQWEHEVLEQRFAQVQKERDELYDQFVGRIAQVQQKTAFKNLVLEKKLTSLKESLEKKDMQLNEVIVAANLDPTTTANITKRLDEIIETKNRQIKDLQYELSKVVKSHNDMIRVYQAKLVEHAIPSEDLGFKPFITKSTVMKPHELMTPAPAAVK